MRSITIQRQHGLLFVVSAVIVLLTIGLFVIKPTSQAQSPAWVPTGSPHPEASQQPATKNGVPTFARDLWNLKAWNEHLYAGYGDYDANGTSISGVQFKIDPFDPKTASYASQTPQATPSAFVLNTEAVPLYRDLGGRLFAPTMDSSANHQSDFAFVTKSGTWGLYDATPAFHIFDVATLNRTDVWMVGADCVGGGIGPCAQTAATVWRSTDGGNSFQRFSYANPTARIDGTDGRYDFARFYFAGVLNNHLYVEAIDHRVDCVQLDPPIGCRLTARTPQGHSLVFDGSSAPPMSGPDLFPRRDLDPSPYGYQPIYFKGKTGNGKMVYLSRFSYLDGPKLLIAFDGMNAINVDIPPGVRNFTVDGSYIYVLAQDGEVLRTSDSSFLSPWESFSPFTDSDSLRPRNASNSIALLNGRMYIGSSEAQLYRYSTILDVIDDQRFFVEQHYRDFLEREGEQGGLDFWTSQITMCGSDANCIALQRVAVSKGFWYSDEFLAKHPALVNPPGVSPKFNNHEFVRLCYFIYLQRDPNLTQLDREGWVFWESAVNSDTANDPNGYDRVIRAFVECSDYRTRFGG